MTNFYNSGFGWICRGCEADLDVESTSQSRSRLMREGESESKNPTFSNKAMAKWHDKEQRTLVCPACGVIELAD
jgi:hypothetical protein